MDTESFVIDTVECAVCRTPIPIVAGEDIPALEICAKCRAMIRARWKIWANTMLKQDTIEK